MANKTVASFPSGSPAQAGDALLMQRGGPTGTTYFLTVGALNTYITQSLNAVQSITVDSTIVKSGTTTNPALAVNAGTNEGQIPVLGDAVKNLAALSNLIYGGQLAMTDPQAPHAAKPIDQVAAELLALIQTAGGVTSISDGTDTLTGAIQLLAGSNVTIAKTGTNAFTISATGGGGGSGVTSLNNLTGIIEIFEGYGINIDSTSQPGKIILSVPNNNLAATYVDVIFDANIQTPAIIYNNGNAGVGATITSTVNGVLGELDNFQVSSGSRLAFINFTSNPAYQGIYVVTDYGSTSTPWILTRASDFNTIDTMLSGTSFTVLNGGYYGGCQVVFNGFNATPPVIGTSTANFVVLPVLDKNAPDGQIMKIDEKFLPTSSGGISSLTVSSPLMLDDSNPQIPALSLDVAQSASDIYTFSPDASKMVSLAISQSLNSRNVSIESPWLINEERIITTINRTNGGTMFIYIGGQNSYGFQININFIDFGSGQWGFLITDYYGVNTPHPTLQDFLANFKFKIWSSNNNSAIITLTPMAENLSTTNFQIFLSGNTGNFFANSYLLYIGILVSELPANMTPANPTVFLPSINYTSDNFTSAGISLYQGITTDFTLPSPIPNFTIITINSPGLKVLLPPMNVTPSPLSKGQIFIIVNGDFEANLSVDICYNDGTVIDTIEPTGARFFSVQDTSTSNGVIVSYPYFAGVLSETRGILTGFPILQPDDLYDNPTGSNHFINESTIIPFINGGTGQTSRQAALNSLAGAVTKSAILSGNGTNIILLLPGSSGQFLSIDGNGNLVWIDDPNVVTEFSWTPVDVNGNPLTVAIGRGRIDGKAVVLDFYIQYASVSGGDYAQINGWNPSINPQDITGVGSASTTTATVSPNGFPNQITLLIDRLAFRCNGVVNVMADVANQYITGHIEYYLDTASISLFKEEIKSGKVAPYDSDAWNKASKELEENAGKIRQFKLEEVKFILNSVSVQSFSDAIESKEINFLTQREYNDIKRRIVDLGADEVRLEMFPEDA